jgi:hypothetical protein
MVEVVIGVNLALPPTRVCRSYGSSHTIPYATCFFQPMLSLLGGVGLALLLAH